MKRKPQHSSIFLKAPSQRGRASPTELKPGEHGITVATWNLLCPVYALKYNDKEGLTNGKDNWRIRGPLIAKLLAESELDVIFLQETSCVASQLKKFGKFESMLALMQPVLENRYHIVHYTHPGRAARDGCAILLQKSTFSLSNHYPHYVSFRSRKWMLEEENLDEKCMDMDHLQVNYMATAIAEATHIGTKRNFRFASTHWYEKKANDPMDSLLKKLKQLAQKDEDPLITVWGGDLNTTRPDVPNFTPSKGGKPTRRGRVIDWIFVNREGGKFKRGNVAARKFIAATMNKLKQTNKRPSDHFADALWLTF